MSRGTGAFAFPDGIPIEPIDRSTTVIVAGPALSSADDLALSMVAEGGEAGEGSLLISTNMTTTKLLDRCRSVHPLSITDRLGIIDCSGQDIGHPPETVRVKYVSTQSDLTGIGMKFSAMYESLYADAREGRVRTGLVSLSSLAMYVDLRKLFQFVQTLSGRIDSAGGVGVFALDPTTHDSRTINTLTRAVDGRIEVRESDGEEDGELRVRGLRDQPDGWQPFSF